MTKSRKTSRKFSRRPKSEQSIARFRQYIARNWQYIASNNSILILQVLKIQYWYWYWQHQYIAAIYCNILSIYRDPQGCDIVATLSVAMISQSLRVAISFISATKILGFLSFFCDICQYRNKISDFFEHFLRYGKYRKKGQKGAKIFVALMSYTRNWKANVIDLINEIGSKDIWSIRFVGIAIRTSIFINRKWITNGIKMDKNG